MADLVWPKARIAAAHSSNDSDHAAAADGDDGAEGRRAEVDRIKAARREQRQQQQQQQSGAAEAKAAGFPPGSPPSAGPSVAYLLEEDVWWLFLDCCLGLRHLHRCGVVHNDLKLENLLLTADVDARGRMQARRLLISDMGNALVKGAEHRRTGMTGTLQVQPTPLTSEHPHMRAADDGADDCAVLCCCPAVLRTGDAVGGRGPPRDVFGNGRLRLFPRASATG